MNDNKVQDERILLERRRIQSTAYGWVVVALLVSIIVQQFFMQAPFAQYAVELFVLMGCGVYTIVCNLKKGIDIWGSKTMGTKKLFLNTLVSGGVAVAALAILSGEYELKNLLLFFVCFVAFSFTLHLIMLTINKKRQAAIDEKLNDDEMDDDTKSDE